jgi:hypothetical protein
MGYTPGLLQKLQDPYSSALAAGGYSMLPGMMQNVGQLGANAGQSLGQIGQIMAPNVAINQGLSNELQAVQQGRLLDVDPQMLQGLQQGQNQMAEQLRASLGPDYMASSAGQEAMNRYNQMANTQVQSAQFNRLQDLFNMQQSGMGGAASIAQQQGQDFYNQAQGLWNQAAGAAAANQQYAQGQQNMLGGIAGNMMNAGAGLTGLAGASVGAQQPYQSDRQLQLQASTYPTGKQMEGMMMGQSGTRWGQIGGSIGGMGGANQQAGSQAGGSSG